MQPRLDCKPTDEDVEIRISLAINRRTRPWLHTILADEQDAHIFSRLARTRINNRRARAYADQPGALA